LEQTKGQWKIADVSCIDSYEGEKVAPLADMVTSTAAAPAVMLSSVTREDWQVYTDTDYGFQISYPQDWTIKPLSIDNPELALPIVQAFALAPRDWEERYEPLVVEVSLGSINEYRRLYPEPDRSEVVDMGGYTATIEEHMYEESRQINYVFQDQRFSDLRVTVLDWTSGFPERMMGMLDKEQLLSAIPLVVSSYRFIPSPSWPGYFIGPQY
jgi:hypothetical protein